MQELELEQFGIYTIENIVKSRTRQNGEKQYLVKWEGYSAKHNTWEGEPGLQGTIALANFNLRQSQKINFQHQTSFNKSTKTKTSQSSSYSRPQKATNGQQQQVKIVNYKNIQNVSNITQIFGQSNKNAQQILINNTFQVNEQPNQNVNDPYFYSQQKQSQQQQQIYGMSSQQVFEPKADSSLEYLAQNQNYQNNNNNDEYADEDSSFSDREIDNFFSFNDNDNNFSDIKPVQFQSNQPIDVNVNVNVNSNVTSAFQLNQQNYYNQQINMNQMQGQPELMSSQQIQQQQQIQLLPSQLYQHNNNIENNQKIQHLLESEEEKEDGSQNENEEQQSNYSKSSQNEYEHVDSDSLVDDQNWQPDLTINLNQNLQMTQKQEIKAQADESALIKESPTNMIKFNLPPHMRNHTNNTRKKTEEMKQMQLQEQEDVIIEEPEIQQKKIPQITQQFTNTRKGKRIQHQKNRLHKVGKKPFQQQKIAKKSISKNQKNKSSKITLKQEQYIDLKEEEEETYTQSQSSTQPIIKQIPLENSSDKEMQLSCIAELDKLIELKKQKLELFQRQLALHDLSQQEKYCKNQIEKQATALFTIQNLQQHCQNPIGALISHTHQQQNDFKVNLNFADANTKLLDNTTASHLKQQTQVQAQQLTIYNNQKEISQEHYISSDDCEFSEDELANKRNQSEQEKIKNKIKQQQDNDKLRQVQQEESIEQTTFQQQQQQSKIAFKQDRLSTHPPPPPLIQLNFANQYIKNKNASIKRINVNANINCKINSNTNTKVIDNKTNQRNPVYKQYNNSNLKIQIDNLKNYSNKHNIKHGQNSQIQNASFYKDSNKETFQSKIMQQQQKQQEINYKNQPHQNHFKISIRDANEMKQKHWGRQSILDQKIGSIFKDKILQIKGIQYNSSMFKNIKELFSICQSHNNQEQINRSYFVVEWLSGLDDKTVFVSRVPIHTVLKPQFIVKLNEFFADTTKIAQIAHQKLNPECFNS